MYTYFYLHTLTKYVCGDMFIYVCIYIDTCIYEYCFHLVGFLKA